MTQSKPVLTILYDSQCPLCSREIAWLRSRNKREQLAFQDIHETTFDPASLNVTLDDLMAEIHGITADGGLIKGIDVFAIMYASVGLAWLAAPLKWPWSRPLCAWLYSGFARNRQRFGTLWPNKSCHNGRCRI